MDIYFSDNYGKLYEELEDGVAEIFVHNDINGCVKHQFIKRKIIPWIDGKQFYDLVTPYGYGGPYIVELKGEKKILVESFQKAFSKYCMDNMIVSEFVRFHPIKRNHRDFWEMYYPIFDRITLGTNIYKYDDPVQEEFSKSCRKNIRQALNKGASYSITEAPESLADFVGVYYSTMDRNNANDYYYFNKTYFQNLIKYFRNNILLVKVHYDNKIVAAGCYFVSDSVVHIHLSGTLSEYLWLSPAYLLRYAVTKWAKENNITYLHHGGGRTNKTDDSLYQFKKRFAKNTEFEFYIGQKIWNKKIYDKLCNINRKNVNSDYFPEYRIHGNNDR
ncbi:GNAT family N-acetyltransferase [Anaerovorax odorimutans]|uniref:GNAT family N-acetyltransferase n=1 Tax=Anaerovorax odorimutans TaxID=109327 RepID=A0ABT1RJC6_9FIRM|nr:GNAT family N-acetyltransferase [Anaerovorax odorimutans]MCQ4635285.1 GNAT family N-acetyltransferase [Anaerovorax odorimutans]